MNWKTLFNTPKERHAFLIGIGEAICFWKPAMCIHNEAIEGEEHYYSFGKAIGSIPYMVIVTWAILT